MKQIYNLLKQNKYLIYSIGLFYLACLLYLPFKIDDAYISYVYSKNLLSGQGLTYNSMVVEGYSNYLWTILITPFLLISKDPLFVARALNFIIAPICLIVTDRLIKLLNTDIGPFRSSLAILSIAISAPFLVWTLAGLETLLFTCLVVFFIYFEIKDQNNVYISSIIVLACSLTRPEGVMLFVVMCFYRLVIKKPHPKKTHYFPVAIYHPLCPIYTFSVQNIWIPITKYSIH